jgi:hypothetical protein
MKQLDHRSLKPRDVSVITLKVLHHSPVVFNETKVRLVADSAALWVAFASDLKECPVKHELELRLELNASNFPRFFSEFQEGIVLGFPFTIEPYAVELSTTSLVLVGGQPFQLLACLRITTGPESIPWIGTPSLLSCHHRDYFAIRHTHDKTTYDRGPQNNQDVAGRNLGNEQASSELLLVSL